MSTVFGNVIKNPTIAILQFLENKRGYLFTSKTVYIPFVPGNLVLSLPKFF